MYSFYCESYAHVFFRERDGSFLYEGYEILPHGNFVHEHEKIGESGQRVQGKSKICKLSSEDESGGSAYYSYRVRLSERTYNDRFVLHRVATKT